MAPFIMADCGLKIAMDVTIHLSYSRRFHASSFGIEAVLPRNEHYGKKM